MEDPTTKKKFKLILKKMDLTCQHGAVNVVYVIMEIVRFVLENLLDQNLTINPQQNEDEDEDEDEDEYKPKPQHMTFSHCARQ